MDYELTKGEILKMAVALEEKGVKFYNELSKKCDGKAKELFLKLAEDEKYHAKIFQKWFDDDETLNSEYLNDEQTISFFSSHMKEIAFADTRTTPEYKTLDEAVLLAIDTEKLAIEFYENVFKVVKEDTKKTVLKLIDEEKLHLEKLKNLKLI